MNIDIKYTKSNFATKQEIEEINDALNKDTFFAKLNYVDILGSGSYGLVMHMRHENNDFAVKISKGDIIQHIPEDISKKHLKIPENQISNTYNNIRFLKYLKRKNIPFVLNQYTDRTVLMVKNDNGVNSLNAKNIWLLEHGNLKDMKRLVDFLSNHSKENFYLILKILLYRLAYSFEKISDKGIIHGDIKPANIFMKTCYPLDSKFKDGYAYLSKTFHLLNLCPIIGDWDLAYYTKSAPSSQMRYTYYYTPIEMTFLSYQNGKRLLMSSLGYKYTLKEDVFALGASMINLMLLNDIEADELEKDDKEFYNIINSMVRPLTYKKVEKVFFKKDYLIYIKDLFLNLDENYRNDLYNLRRHFKDMMKHLNEHEMELCKKYLTESHQEKNNNIITSTLLMAECFKDLTLKRVDEIFQARYNYEKDYKTAFENYKTIFMNVLKYDIAAVLTKKRNNFKQVLQKVTGSLMRYNINALGTNPEEIKINLIDSVLLIETQIPPDVLSVSIREKYLLGRSYKTADFNIQKQICHFSNNKINKNVEDSYLFKNKRHFVLNKGTVNEICDYLYDIDTSDNNETLPTTKSIDKSASIVAEKIDKKRRGEIQPNNIENISKVTQNLIDNIKPTTTNVATNQPRATNLKGPAKAIHDAKQYDMIFENKKGELNNSKQNQVPKEQLKALKSGVDKPDIVRPKNKPLAPINEENIEPKHPKDLQELYDDFFNFKTRHNRVNKLPKIDLINNNKKLGNQDFTQSHYLNLRPVLEQRKKTAKRPVIQRKNIKFQQMNDLYVPTNIAQNRVLI